MNKRLPKISVLMPVNNGERFLADSLKSIGSQTFSDYELIVVDDGSTDSTLEILQAVARRDARIRVLNNTVQKGISYSLNLGADVARGEYIARMDVDDLSLDSRFEDQMQAFDAEEGLVMCGSNALHVDEVCRPIYPTTLPLDDWDIRCVALFENPFVHSAVMMRSDVFRSAGAYNLDYSTTQDYDLWTRILKFGKVRNLRPQLVKLRRHENSVSAVKNSMQLDRTVMVQCGYVAEFLCINDWDKDRFSNINRYLFRSSLLPSSNVENSIDSVRDALGLMDKAQKMYPDRSTVYLRSYVLGRCIWSLCRRPIRRQQLCMLKNITIEDPKGMVRAIAWLISVAWRVRTC